MHLSAQLINVASVSSTECLNRESMFDSAAIIDILLLLQRQKFTHTNDYI